jgi:hypothetical protein
MMLFGYRLGGALPKVRYVREGYGRMVVGVAHSQVIGEPNFLSYSLLARVSAFCWLAGSCSGIREAIVPAWIARIMSKLNE